MTLKFADPQRRWTPKRKAALLAVIDAGEMERGVLDRLGLSEEELQSWRRDFSDHGVHGLHVYSLHYHHPSRRKAARHRLHSRHGIGPDFAPVEDGMDAAARGPELPSRAAAR
jgi:hypothetical protein